MGWLAAISNFFKAIGETMGFVNKRTDLKNAPAIVAAQILKNEQKEIDASRKAIATNDIEEQRRRDAE
jgi:hypothetical protein